jgi:hypothetical protein
MPVLVDHEVFDELLSGDEQAAYMLIRPIMIKEGRRSLKQRA